MYKYCEVNMIKMIVLDLDGTILDSNSKVSDNTKRYLNKLKEKGYIIVIATGRNFASAFQVTNKAIFANYIISDTGSCIYNAQTAEALFLNTIARNDALKILNSYNDECEYIDVCDKNWYYKYCDYIYKSDLTIATNKVDDIVSNCQNISHMSLSFKDYKKVNEIYQNLSNEFKNLNIIIMQDSFSEKKWIEILPFECSKYNAIKKLADYLKIANEEIICFGDGLNDLEMSKKCGIGIALKNALPEVKENAKDVTAYDNDNDGVIKYLQKLIDND